MSLIPILQKHQNDIGSLFAFDLNDVNIVVSDCSSNNSDLTGIDITDVQTYAKVAHDFLQKHNAIAGVGGYLENRIIYTGRDLFEKDEEQRTIHLGIDVSVKAQTPLYVPIDAHVHSFANNATSGDYGPTIILEHTLEEITFYTLYGHLTLDSLEGLEVGQKLEKGTAFAKVGDIHENGNWPPHLHFQLITDMQGKEGDYPGVCAPSELEKYKNLCPNPNWILKIAQLEY